MFVHVYFTFTKTSIDINKSENNSTQMDANSSMSKNITIILMGKINKHSNNIIKNISTIIKTGQN